WFGQPKPRVISFSLGPDGPPAMATFVQRPRLGRWIISLLGLVTVAAIFALVLSTVADRLVDEAGVDDALIDQALTQPGAGGGKAVSVTPSVVAGKVVVASTGQGVAGVQADLYSSDNGVVPLATAATDGSGAYAFGRLPAGRYRVRFTGAGFDEQWYQASQTFADATDIEVEAGATVALADLEIGGRPGSVSGKVVVPDPVGTLARLVVPGLADTETNALVADVSVSADGTFEFADVPSPANYQLIVSKQGYATEVRDVVLRAAQDLEGIQVVMREGDGVVAGLVQSPSGPLGGVTVTATGGEVEVSTVTLTLDAVGTFAVRTLPTPGQYTLTFVRPGYSSATRTVDLAAAQQLSGLSVTLSPTTGAIAGTVSVGDRGPAGGVTVTVTGADVDQSTITASVGEVGTYVFDSLPVPATYTITFSKPGLLSQTRLVDLDPLAGRGSAFGIDARMVPSTAIVRGIVRTTSGVPVPGASVQLNDGSESRDLLSADDPLGRFEFSGVDPGAYTLTASRPGTSPSVLLVNVIAADVVDLTVNLEPQASLFGRVLVLDPTTGQFVPFAPCAVPPVAGPPCGAVVRLFDAGDFPGLPSQAIATAATDAEGAYTFASLPAPDDFVVSVYVGEATDPLDSVLEQTQPSQAVEVPTFQIRQAS
ncbi:MAG: carboxypeptidase-like regulatory domain-containing protein, partial [Ilumatobacteraceae bacterium]